MLNIYQTFGFGQRQTEKMQRKLIFVTFITLTVYFYCLYDQHKSVEQLQPGKLGTQVVTDIDTVTTTKSSNQFRNSSSFKVLYYIQLQSDDIEKRYPVTVLIFEYSISSAKVNNF